MINHIFISFSTVQICQLSYNYLYRDYCVTESTSRMFLGRVSDVGFDFMAPKNVFKISFLLCKNN